jgi:phenylacetate-CoA ligase
MSEHLLWLMDDIKRARKQGITAIMQRQRARFTEMVAFARTHSPYYRERYRGLPEKVEDPGMLPMTSKKELMARFDDWVTDRSVASEHVSAFVDTPDLIGERYLGKYLVATTSGTTGNLGIFLMDERALAVNMALTSRAMSAWLSVSDVISLVARGGRMAMIVATEGHFLAIAGAMYLRKANRWIGSAMQFFSVHLPLPELVSQLNRFRPAIILGYGSTMALLASEQAAGRLQINPVLLEPAGETLTQAEYERIARQFHCKVRDLYGATECPFLSSDCAYGWYHVNSDWVVVEPVDADYQPTPPGELSHTVLISNLANRVQPILRYDLGDSILLRPDPCPCGSPLPAIHVQGRAANVLTFPTDRGEQVSIVPLAFDTLLARIRGIELFQIVHLPASYHLDHVALEHAEEAPEQSPGGKYRTILPLSRLR